MRPPYTRYDEGVGVLDMLRMIRVIDQHQPSRSEAIELTGWSYPTIKRIISTARLLGVQIVAVRAHGGPPYYRLDDTGPLDPAALRRLYRKAWL
jgi:hypothetical protein